MTARSPHRRGRTRHTPAPGAECEGRERFATASPVASVEVRGDRCAPHRARRRGAAHARGRSCLDGAVSLSATEYGLLRALSLAAGRVVTYEALLRQVWEGRETGDVNLVRNFVKRLRAKLGEDAASPTWIVNVRAVGYRMAAPGEPGPGKAAAGGAAPGEARGRSGGP